MSQFSTFLHSQGGNSLFSFLAAFLTEAVEANNPKYTPLIAPVSSALQAELSSLAAGNPATPHVGDGSTETSAPVVAQVTTTVATPSS